MRSAVRGAQCAVRVRCACTARVASMEGQHPSGRMHRVAAWVCRVAAWVCRVAAWVCRVAD